MTQSNAKTNSFKTRALILATAAIVGMSFQATTASAYSSSVRSACMGDYLSHCSHTMPGSAKLRSCMRKAGPRLSRGCVTALIGAGLVSKAEVRRRAAQK